LRELATHQRKPFGYQLASPVDVAARLEDDSDDGQSLERPGSHAFDAGQAVHRIFDRLGDENFNLFRAQAGRFRLDRDLGWRELRENIVFGIAKREPAVTEQRTAQRQDNSFETNGESNQSSLWPGRALSRTLNHYRRHREARSSPLPREGLVRLA